jgi:hypothetical protein
MDFISIAESTSLRAMRRLLDEEDDDFAQLDTSHSSHTKSSQASDSILDMTKEAATLTQTDDNLENAPILSASAEAELFLLATNFLLCEFSIFGVEFLDGLSWNSMLLCRIHSFFGRNE